MAVGKRPFRIELCRMNFLFRASSQAFVTAVCSRALWSRRALAFFGAACVLGACGLTGQGAQADTTLWQYGVADDSAAEFADYPKAPVTKVSS